MAAPLVRYEPILAATLPDEGGIIVSTLRASGPGIYYA
jgi:hypothetical protein